jgi:uncharacterized membrane protein
MPSPAHKVCRLLAAVLFIFAAALALPKLAFAKSYDISNVNITATVGTDGTVTVFETRTFDFDGDFQGVYWKLPKGEYDGRVVTPTNISVGIASDADGGADQAGLQSFDAATTGKSGSYTITSYDDYDEVKLYSTQSDDSVTFYISYQLPQLATRWADTSELYWKYVSDGWDVDSDNVSCTLVLPVPAGETFSAGDNVRAWGHGPLDGTVSFDEDAGQVIFTNPSVSSDDYAEMRVCFPASWLSAATTANTEDSDRLDEVLSEEQQWTDEANAERQRARLMIGAGIFGAAALVAFTIVMAYLSTRRYRNSHKASFDDTYFRDIPSADHPAIIGALMHGKPDSDELTASLMRLTDEKMAKLEQVTLSSGGLIRKKSKEDWRLTLLRQDLLEPAPATSGSDKDYNDALDRATAKFAFESVASRSSHVRDESGSPILCFSDVKKVAETHREEYASAYQAWVAKVSACTEERGLFVDPHHVSKVPLIALGVLDEIMACLLFVFGVSSISISSSSLGSLFMPILITAIVALVALIVAGIIAFVQAGKFRDLSPEAVEIVAKTEALERWLRDFTRLEEAVPQDIILWDHLLIMAVALGVSKEVIEQLKVACPQFFDETGDFGVVGGYYFSSYIWFAGGGPMRYGFPADTFSSALSSAVNVATSHNSSGFGGGGGFSGGGGGGFGGGGGGGAF